MFAPRMHQPASYNFFLQDVRLCSMIYHSLVNIEVHFMSERIFVNIEVHIVNMDGPPRAYLCERIPILHDAMVDLYSIYVPICA